MVLVMNDVLLLRRNVIILVILIGWVFFFCVVWLSFCFMLFWFFLVDMGVFIDFIVLISYFRFLEFMRWFYLVICN